MAKEMKQIVGIEISEGTSKKTGKAYSIGALYTMTKLAPPLGEDNVATGYMGDKYSCNANVLRKIQHLPFPVNAEVETESVMRFGERQDVVIDVRPVAASTKGDKDFRARKSIRMATYNCVPSSQTVSPCPAGTAPDVTSVESTQAIARYEGHFDHVPPQDVMVGIAMAVSMLLGVMSGRR